MCSSYEIWLYFRFRGNPDRRKDSNKDFNNLVDNICLHLSELDQNESECDEDSSFNIKQ